MMTNPVGRITQGQFSYLPALSDAEITLQIEYGLGKGYAWSVEYTDDPHPRNTYWEMFGLPMFDLKDAELPQSLSPALHPAHGIRLHAGGGIDGDELHRQPAERRARLRIETAGSARPHHSLHRA